MISKERFELTLQQIKDSVAPDYVGPRGWFVDGRRCIVNEAMTRLGLHAGGNMFHISEWDRMIRQCESSVRALLTPMASLNDQGVKWHTIIDWAMGQPKPMPPIVSSGLSLTDLTAMMKELYAPIKEEELVNA